MNNAKVTVPREVADAIESFRRAGRDNAYIAGIAISDGPGTWISHSFFIRSFPFDTLMAALINGYTVEKSAEEIAEDERKATYERIYRLYIRKVSDSKKDHLEFYRGNDAGYADGIAFVLNELNVKIPGVNAPETEVSV